MWLHTFSTNYNFHQLSLKDMFGNKKSNHKVAPFVSNTTDDDSSERKADRLVACLRDVLLKSNTNGEFATLGITPRVLVKNFEYRIQTLVQTTATYCVTISQHQQPERNDDTPAGGLATTPQIHVEYAFRNKRVYTEGQLRIQLRVGDSIFPAVTLLTFSGKVADDPFFQQLLPQVKTVLDDFFPVVIMHTTTTTINFSSLDNLEKGIAGRRQHERATRTGGELGAALAAFEKAKQRKKNNKPQRGPEKAQLAVAAGNQEQSLAKGGVVNKLRSFSRVSTWQFLRVTSVMAMVAVYFWYFRPSL